MQPMTNKDGQSVCRVRALMLFHDREPFIFKLGLPTTKDIDVFIEIRIQTRFQTKIRGLKATASFTYFRLIGSN